MNDEIKYEPRLKISVQWIADLPMHFILEIEISNFQPILPMIDQTAHQKTDFPHAYIDKWIVFQKRYPTLVMQVERRGFKLRIDGDGRPFQ